MRALFVASFCQSILHTKRNIRLSKTACALCEVTEQGRSASMIRIASKNFPVLVKIES